MFETDIRNKIVAAYKRLSDKGLNKGASGNVSARFGDQMLITPSGIPSVELMSDQIAKLSLEDQHGAWEGPCKPSSEWQCHQAILASKDHHGAVVHTHSPFATILSILRKPIPAVHYMMAAFGTSEIGCSAYATYGTCELSETILDTMGDSAGCLMANHGMIVAGSDVAHAFWLAEELEQLASQYYHAVLVGEPHVLSTEELQDAAHSFSSYGPQSQPQ